MSDLGLLDAVVAIRRVQVAYMAACDAHDPDAVAELFHPDGRFEPLRTPGEVLIGRDAVRASYALACARLSFCVHHLTDERVMVRGDTAWAAWSYFEPATVRDATAVWTAGRYEHELTKRDGVWRYSVFRVGALLGAPFDGAWVPEPIVPLP